MEQERAMTASTRRRSKITPTNRGQHPRANGSHYRDLRFAIQASFTSGDRNLVIDKFRLGLVLKGLGGRQWSFKMSMQILCRLEMVISLRLETRTRARPIGNGAI